MMQAEISLLSQYVRIGHIFETRKSEDLQKVKRNGRGMPVCVNGNTAMAAFKSRHGFLFLQIG